MIKSAGLACMCSDWVLPLKQSIHAVEFWFLIKSWSKKNAVKKQHTYFGKHACLLTDFPIKYYQILTLDVSC